MTTAARKWVYALAEGDGRNKIPLGGKGANLCEMTRIGLDVPPGFVITTDACLAYLADATRRLPEGLLAEARLHMAALEQKTGKRAAGCRREFRITPAHAAITDGSALDRAA